MNSIARHPREIFLADIRMPEDALSPYLDQVCGSDSVLRLRVAALLQAHLAVGTIELGSGSEQCATLLVPTVSEAPAAGQSPWGSPTPAASSALPGGPIRRLVDQNRRSSSGGL